MLSSLHQIIVGNFALSHDQERVQMAVWAILAAPLLMSNDLRNIRPESRALLLNRNLIAINQDPLGISGTQVTVSAGFLVTFSPAFSQNYI